MGWRILCLTANITLTMLLSHSLFDPVWRLGVLRSDVIFASALLLWSERAKWMKASVSLSERITAQLQLMAFDSHALSCFETRIGSENETRGNKGRECVCHLSYAVSYWVTTTLAGSLINMC